MGGGGENSLCRQREFGSSDRRQIPLRGKGGDGGKMPGMNRRGEWERG